MATLMKQSLLPEFESVERRLRRMIETGPFTGLIPGFVPAADVYETPTEFVVELEVPGYAEPELALEVSDHTLRIKGERETVTEKTEKTYRVQERLEGTFTRSFQLPVEADTEHVAAEFSKGVLKVHAPKLATATPHKIAITTKTS